eukprot:Partr_v1_DN27978_c0_g2_i5_m11726 putative denticleless E3 ubiquitin protein ligase homolog (Drosophila)
MLQIRLICSVDIFASCSRDGSWILHDTRSRNESLHVPNAHIPASALNKRKRRSKFKAAIPTCAVIAVMIPNNQEFSLVSVGGSDGLIKFWDMRNVKQCSNAMSPSPDCTRGFTSLDQDSHGRHMFASCMDNKTYRIDLHSHKVTQEYSAVGYSCKNFYVKTAVSPADTHIVSSSAYGPVFVWDINDPSSRWKLDAHGTSSTCGVSWSADGSAITSVGDDLKLRFWHANIDNSLVDVVKAEVLNPDNDKTITENKENENISVSL